ncbi:CBS domain-containing protein [Neobacillus sp. D3-1R]|uniref:CBS domain-containing protein n=1 Tax=Neobacillus sp. D3-1R TaxID=3445778 RepID=UPI003FA0F2CB
MEKTTPLAARFESAFNRIHKSLIRIVRDAKHDHFKGLLDEGDSYAIIRMYRDDLYQYGKLRNAIVHDKVKQDYYIAEPHEEIVLQIEKIAEELEKPKKALEIASSPVLYYKEETPLKDILKVVDRLSYSQYPIVDTKGIYKWLLTTEGIIRWLNKQPLTGLSLKNVVVKDLLPYEKLHQVVYVNSEADIYEVEAIFEEHHLAKKKLKAVIVTQNGKTDEKPLGIITAWDLVEIDAIDQELE